MGHENCYNDIHVKLLRFQIGLHSCGLVGAQSGPQCWQWPSVTDLSIWRVPDMMTQSDSHAIIWHSESLKSSWWWLSLIGWAHTQNDPYINDIQHGKWEWAWNGTIPRNKGNTIVENWTLGRWFLRQYKDYKMLMPKYHKTSNISHIFAGNKTVNHTDVVGALPVGPAPTTSSFLPKQLALTQWAETTARRDEKHLSFGISCLLY